MNEPKRHHYIPQFILRNFCYDDKGHLFYYDISTGKTNKCETKEVFKVSEVDCLNCNQYEELRVYDSKSGECKPKK